MLAFIITDAEARPRSLPPSFAVPSIDRSMPSALKATPPQMIHYSAVQRSEAGNRLSRLVTSSLRPLKRPRSNWPSVIVDDGEEATHRLTIDVLGTRTEDEARRVAKSCC